MRRAPFLVSTVLAHVLAPLSASAQTTEEPPRVQQIKAVERGWFFETDIGLGLFVNKLDDRAYGLSVLTGVFAGYDILPILALQVGAVAMAAPVSQSEDTPLPRGDLLFLMPMLQVQFAVITTERNFLWLRGGAGFGFGLPETLGDADNDGVEEDYGGAGPVFSATVGFERFTKLRHFSIGVQAGVLGVTKPSFGLGVIVAPTLKYTF